MKNREKFDLILIIELQVLLLEAGGEELKINEIPSTNYILQGSSVDWNYRTVPDENSCRGDNGCTMPRGKVS